ncbi:extracellular solute-binding protein [Nitrospirota bacterium]
MILSMVRILMIIMVSGVLFAMSTNAAAQKWEEKYLIEKDVPGPYSYEEINKKDYSGITLNVITHEPPNLGEAVMLHARQFEELTGAKINVKPFVYRNLYSEVMWGLRGNKYDVYFYGGEWLADVAPFFEPLPRKMLESKQYKDISKPYKRMSMWEGVPKEVKIDGDKHYMQYRMDLLEDPKYKSQFKAKYGRDLVPPRTWEEYAEVAKFFHGKTMKNGRVIYGAAEITKWDDLVYSQFFKRAAAYAKHPDVKGGYYFELETMTPLINTPGFVEALRDFVEIQDYLPPGGSNFTLVDALKSFGWGESVLSDMWDDAFVKAMEPTSDIRNKVGASLSPGSKKVWNRRTGKWDEFPEINYVPYLPESWGAGVAKSSKHKEAAFDFLGFYSNWANHKSDMLVGRRGMNPFRNSDMERSFWIEKAGWGAKSVDTYMETLKEFSESEHHAYAFNIIEGRRYLVVLTEQISKALKGQIAPQQALDEVAIKWDELTRRIGVEKQKKAYSNIVRLEDGEIQ